MDKLGKTCEEINGPNNIHPGSDGSFVIIIIDKMSQHIQLMKPIITFSFLMIPGFLS